MGTTTTTIVAYGVAVLAVAVAVALAVLLRREHRRTAEVLAAGRAEADALRARVDELAARMSTAAPAVAPAQFLITDIDQPRPEPTVSDRVVLSATLGEPLVRTAAFAHGVRRALSARSRNRIWFEMRREVRASRKRRRREVRDHLRRTRAADRAGETLQEHAA